MTMFVISPQQVENVVHVVPHGLMSCALLYPNALVLHTSIKTHLCTTQPKRTL